MPKNKRKYISPSMIKKEVNVVSQEFRLISARPFSVVVVFVVWLWYDTYFRFTSDLAALPGFFFLL